MARVATITDREQLAEQDQEIGDEIIKSRGQLGIVWGTLLQSPVMAGRLAHLGTYIRFDSKVPDAERELAMIVAAASWACEVELNGHSKAALSFGVSQQAVDAVKSGGPVDGLPENEARIMRFARAVVEQHRVPDDLYKDAVATYGEQAVVDLLATIGYMCCVASLINGLEIGH